VDEAAAGLGGLDAFVMCAVTPVATPIEWLGPDELERTIAANARPFVLGGQAAARHMEAGGRIVGVSATGAHRVRNASYSPLALAKGVVEAAVRFLAVSLAERGITVNAVAPGPTDTEAFDAMAEDAAALRARLAAATPIGRMGTPEEAGWITGQLIFSDGGYSLV
jgi:3-oxoacyl-[acyl-carrier protein] reductase